MNQSTLNKLNQMHLWGMEATLKGILGSVQNDKLTADELVELLVQSEWEYRENQKISRCLNNAAFRYQAFLDNIDYSPGRKLDKNLIMRLADCSYIERAENVIITGATGVGKSYIATALGHQACLKGKKVLYRNAQKLFTQLRISRADGSYVKEMAKIEKKDVFIIDDFGLEVLDHKTSLMLLEILEDRIGKKTTIIASQLPYEKWYDVITEKTIADAIMDRLINSSHKITLYGESMRKKK